MCAQGSGFLFFCVVYLMIGCKWVKFVSISVTLSKGALNYIRECCPIAKVTLRSPSDFLFVCFFQINPRVKRFSWTCLRMNTGAWRSACPHLHACYLPGKNEFLSPGPYICAHVCYRVNRWMWSTWWWMLRCCCHPLELLWQASTLWRGSLVETWRRHAGYVNANPKISRSAVDLLLLQLFSFTLMAADGTLGVDIWILTYFLICKLYDFDRKSIQ